MLAGASFVPSRHEVGCHTVPGQCLAPTFGHFDVLIYELPLDAVWDKGVFDVLHFVGLQRYATKAAQFLLKADQ